MDQDGLTFNKDLTGLHLHGHPEAATGISSLKFNASERGDFETGTGNNKSSISRKAKPKRSVSWSHVSGARSTENLSASRMSSKPSSFDEILHRYEVDEEPKHLKSLPKSSIPSDSEHSQRLSAFGISLTSTLSDVVLVYPCLVLRRQCQVNNVGRRYHFTPFTIIGVALNLQRSQGFTCLWKGIGSHLMINALTFGIESAVSESSRKLPREIDQHSKMRDVAGHLMLKALSAALIIPFYSAHLVESIQSEAASETPGIFYFIMEGFSRLFGFAGVQSRRMLPFRHLLIPTVLYFVLRYVLNNILQYGILIAFRQYEKRKHQQVLNNNGMLFPQVDTAYLSVPSTSSAKPQHVSSHSAQRSSYSTTSTQYQELLSSFIAQFVTDVLLYPFETILFRLHVQGTRTIIDDMDRGSGFLPLSSRYEGILDCFNTVKIYEGKRALFRGFGALILQYSMKFSILKLMQLVLQFSSPRI